MSRRPGAKRARIVVTAGPTREKIDPVRFISNYSTGVFGYEIAKEASRRGCRVTLVSGPTALENPPFVKMIKVKSALEMKAAVEKAVKGADCLIMAAAVSDWRVERPSAKKLKRGSGKISLRLVENPDILAGIATNDKRKLLLVGFALETGVAERNALKKLKQKKLDMIVANSIGKGSDPFGYNNTDIMIYDKRGGVVSLHGATKRKAAKIILDKAFSFNI
jgi:phosphopantothenoylcysteine decarboxylase/phosphopantothenate--cysteine ligase